MPLDSDKIEELGEAPLKTRTVEGTVEERTMDEIIKAKREVEMTNNCNTVPWGMRIATVRPGGTV